MPPAPHCRRAARECRFGLTRGRTTPNHHERWQCGELANGEHIVDHRVLQLGPTDEPDRNSPASIEELSRRSRVVETDPRHATFDLQVAEGGTT
jgi:hypothetical protein